METRPYYGPEREAEKVQAEFAHMIAQAFAYHQLTGKEAEAAKEIQREFKELAFLVAARCRDSRERFIAITNLQAAYMVALAALAKTE